MQTKTKSENDSTCAIFLKNRHFEDIKYDNERGCSDKISKISIISRISIIRRIKKISKISKNPEGQKVRKSGSQRYYSTSLILALNTVQY